MHPPVFLYCLGLLAASFNTTCSPVNKQLSVSIQLLITFLALIFISSVTPHTEENHSGKFKKRKKTFFSLQL